MLRSLLILLVCLGAAVSARAASLASLTATGQTRQVLVQWELLAADQVARIDIARNGLTAAKMPVNAGSASCSWTDREVQHDRLYSYTLTAVLRDGSREQLGTVSARPAYDAAVVADYKLHQNFPNPFNPETTIEVELAEDGPAQLTVFDILGQVVATPLSTYARGKYSVLFSGRDLPSGVYLYQLRAGVFTDQKKMVLLK
ncbi:MAG: T9SS type A sorting domain-containing protein [bacterium]|nr:T9SS type A sorting domain-containing protein [bacterium]